MLAALVGIATLVATVYATPRAPMGPEADAAAVRRAPRDE